MNSISSLKVFDEYEPIEENLDHVKIERFLCQLTITLTMEEPEDTDQLGY